MRKRRALVAMLAVTLSAMGAAAEAGAKKGKKKGKPAVTRFASAPLASNASATAAAACGKGTHVSGGGFAVAPSFQPFTSGLRSHAATSFPTGPKGWSATASAFSNPSAAGSLTAYARCERNSLGQLTSRIESSTTLNPGTAATISLSCAPGTHMLSGGYVSTAATTLTNVLGFRALLFRSLRTGPARWEVTAFNNGLGPSPTAVPFTAYALCERNAKGRGVSEASSLVPIAADARTAADASCAKKQHVVAGGFEISPYPSGPPVNLPAVGIDEFHPVGKRGWHMGVHEWQTVALPPGSALRAIAYCKKG